ncbi:hypothetical protein ACFVTF_21820, partial [Kitasatospora sp. NPDC057940]|uniref:hypothetical protein n=1 Tax=Kitasatospora sp. NPDC057940 TaxID=3346285 RepID=UPI0036DEF0BF
MRSSAAPESDRHLGVADVGQLGDGVAILGHPEGQPPRLNLTDRVLAVLELRSSAAPESDRHLGVADVGQLGDGVAILGHP